MAMRRTMSPLEPLKRLREERVEARSLELARAVTARAAAHDARASAEDELGRVRARAAATRGAERVALAKGELFARDLLRAGTWELAVSAEDAARVSAAVAARAGEERAIQEQGRCQAQVAVAKADLEATRRLVARRRALAARAEEAREEEAIAEAMPVRRG